MAQPYVGEIRIFAGNFPPNGWAFCDGSIMPISENDTLFNLIGTTYGGDGQNTFALPDLRSRVPVHMGASFVIGQSAGSENVTLTTLQIPAHTHVPQVNAAGGIDSPANSVWGSATGATPYGAPPTNATMNPASVQASPGSQPHENMIPFQALNYIISLFGIFPSQN
ncbi:MAG: tail fiber protein [Chitinophagaceae bacterium]